MRASKKNPAENSMPKGMSDEALADALARSGYPLQGVVAELLLPDWRVLEEWGYLDSPGKKHRSLDLFAHRDQLAPDPKSRLGITLLIECKRSIHPYVFFKSIPDNLPYRFPVIAGARSSLPLRNLAGNRSRVVPAAELLGLNQEKFVKEGPPRCATFTRALAAGKKVKVSGTEPFRSLVLPLAKALDHFVSLRKPQQSAKVLFPDLTLAVAVVDAPMLLVEDPNNPRDPVLAPWVRVVRREADPSALEARTNWYRFYTIDVVHVGFFTEYLDSHLLPFGEIFYERAGSSLDVLIGGGKVESLDAWKWQDVRPS